MYDSCSPFATQALADNQQKAFADWLPCVVAFNSHSVVITTHLHCNSYCSQFCSDSSLLLAAGAAALGHKGTYTVGLITHYPGLITQPHSALRYSSAYLC